MHTSAAAAEKDQSEGSADGSPYGVVFLYDNLIFLDHTLHETEEGTGQSGIHAACSGIHAASTVRAYLK